MAPKHPTLSEGFPALVAPGSETLDPGTVRLGDCSLTGDFPALVAPEPEIADPGTVRLGDCSLTGDFPART
jgi:hypothetical protein